MDGNHTPDDGVRAVHPQNRVYPVVPCAASLGADVAEIAGVALTGSRFRPAVEHTRRIEVPAVPVARTSFVDVPFIDVEGEEPIIQTPYKCHDTNTGLQLGEIHRSLDTAASSRLEFGVGARSIGRSGRWRGIRRQ